MRFYAPWVMAALGLLMGGCIPSAVEDEGAPCPAALCAPVVLSNNQAAAVVIGQPNFTQVTAPASPTASNLNLNEGTPFFDGTNLYVGDQSWNRVLGYAGLPTASTPSASFVIGQANAFTTSLSGTTAANFSAPATVFEANGQFFIVDQGNFRVLIYSTPPTSSVSANVAVGQPNLTTAVETCSQSGLMAPRSVIVAGGKLIVADTIGNRVMIWNTVPATSGVNADLVLGQTSFTSCTANQGGTATAGTLNAPAGVWSDGTRLVVADWSNSRILIWNSFPTSNGQLADLSLGQGTGAAAFTSTTAASGQAGLSDPPSVDSNGSQLAVADDINNRVLVWNSFPTQSGALPDVVLGQPDFVSNSINQGGASGGANTLHFPFGVRFVDNILLVSDAFNSRLLIYYSQ